MRTPVLVPCFTLAAVFGALGIVSLPASGGEPTDAQMQTAFERRLADQVQAALDFAAETGGPQAVAAIRASGTDRFEVTAFRKERCTPDPDGSGHVCAFTAEIAVTNGILKTSLSARFITAPETRTVRLDALLDGPATFPRTRA